MGVNIKLILTKMSVIKEVKSDHEARSDTSKEDIGKFCKANVAPMLTCTGCNGFFRGPVTYCQNKHGLCSSCFGDKEECPITGCAMKASLTLDFPAELVRELKFPVSCKFKNNGCDQENDDVEVIADHEIECRHRKVPCFAGGCSEQPAMDFAAHLFTHIRYRKFRDNPGKWFFHHFTGIKMLAAQKIWIDPESGHGFRAVLVHNDQEKYWKCSTVVFAGKN